MNDVLFNLLYAVVGFLGGIGTTVMYYRVAGRYRIRLELEEE